MSRSATETFTRALSVLEQERDVKAIVACFAADATLANLSTSESGTDGANRFWTLYRDQFDNIRSEFNRIIESNDEVVLVWRAQGTLRGGSPIAYSGVSLITFSGDKIRAFETIYDSAAFLRGGAPTSA